MEVVHQAGKIDDTGLVDVPEANNELGPIQILSAQFRPRSSLAPPLGWSGRLRFDCQVLIGPGLIPVSVVLGGMQGQAGIAQVRTGHDREIGAAGSQHRIRMVGPE